MAKTSAQFGPQPVLRALIFDVDGTLAETEELHRRAFNRTFSAYGLPWNWSRSDYARLLKTTGGKERIARYMAETNAKLDVDIAALHRDKTAIYADLVSKGGLCLRSGIADLISDARKAGILVGVATTTNAPNVDALCKATFGIEALRVFDAVAAGDQVVAKKPAPDVYQLALQRLGVAPSEAVALEDSRNGLLSAQAAGIACIISPSAYTEGEDFNGALHVTPQFSGLGGVQGLRQTFQRVSQ